MYSAPKARGLVRCMQVCVSIENPLPNPMQRNPSWWYSLTLEKGVFMWTSWVGCDNLQTDGVFACGLAQPITLHPRQKKATARAAIRRINGCWVGVDIRMFVKNWKTTCFSFAKSIDPSQPWGVVSQSTERRPDRRICSPDFHVSTPSTNSILPQFEAGCQQRRLRS